MLPFRKLQLDEISGIHVLSPGKVFDRLTSNLDRNQSQRDSFVSFITFHRESDVVLSRFVLSFEISRRSIPSVFRYFAKLGWSSLPVEFHLNISRLANLSSATLAEERTRYHGGESQRGIPIDV